MPTFLVQAVYRCDIGGKPTENRDFQVIPVIARGWRHAVGKVLAVKPHRYRNRDRAWVTWTLVDVMSWTRLDGIADLEELTGFIAERSELFGKMSYRRPSIHRWLRSQADSSTKRMPD